MQIKSIPQMMPDAWPVFFHQRQLRPLQEKVIPALLRGDSILLSGPTASGKTEAVVAPLYQRHISFCRRSLGVVYVAPTKALVNDLYYRLDTYLGTRSTGTIRRYTGDHHELTTPDGLFLLFATPEALDSIQLVSPEKLAGIRAVVVDEIHLLHGTPRGQQLRHVISRIEKCSHTPIHPKDAFQRIGLTATIDDMEEVGRCWLGGGASTIGIREQRDIELTLLDLENPGVNDKPLRAAEVIAKWLEVKNPRKILVFGNSRNGTHALAAALNQELSGTRWPVHWHTGILSKGERERIEEAMRGDRFGVCVATSTLEVGIDIGDIDAVILCDPPHSVGSFLQRIGRGNRKTDVCQVVALFGSEQEKLLIHALYDCGRRGVIDDVHEYDRQSVRFQQVMSFAWKGVARDKKPLLLKNLAAVTCDCNNGEVVSDMLETGALVNLAGALVPSDQFVDIGNTRTIHSVISGDGNFQIADGVTGEILISTQQIQDRSGALFVGGGMKRLNQNSAGEMSLERLSKASGALIKLPSARGKRMLSRNIVWAIAELSGEDPRRWKSSKQQLVTWGGEYNRLLALLVKLYAGNKNEKINVDDYSIQTLYHLPDINPKKVLAWAFELENKKNIPMKNLLPFCDKSKFFSNLSHELQWKEAFLSIPFHGFKKWLNECIFDDVQFSE